MSKKEDLFSKLNIKDYNNQLENVLENKSFTEGAKNILLNILYKIETSYEDYKKVKIHVPLKRELQEEIIKIVETKCDEIELVKPKINGETKLGDKKYIVENNKIISYPNEKNVFYAINHLNNDLFIINTEYKTLREPMQEFLKQGYIIDKEELIRDFDGWTWNILAKDIEDYSYNIMFQNIRILFGNEFIQNLIKNEQVDFIDEFENKIKEKLSEDNKTDITKLIYQIAIVKYLKNNKTKKANILKVKQDLEEKLKEMSNKKEYLQAKATSKKIVATNIKEIDKKINNNKLLRESFIEENKSLEEDKQIFSLSEYIEVLQVRRSELLKELENLSTLMKPMNFVKTKEIISKEYEILNEINFNKNKQEEQRILINLQKEFLKLINKKIENVQSKKEIMQFIYLLRYYKLIYTSEKKQIKDMKELAEAISKTEKNIITKACKLKALNALCQDIEENFKIVAKVLSYNIIELEDVNLEFKKHDKNIILTIYDDETIEDTIIYDMNKELNVKFNKKIKLFN